MRPPRECDTIESQRDWFDDVARAESAADRPGPFDHFDDPAEDDEALDALVATWDGPAPVGFDDDEGEF